MSKTRVTNLIYVIKNLTFTFYIKNKSNSYVSINQWHDTRIRLPICYKQFSPNHAIPRPVSTKEIYIFYSHNATRTLRDPPRANILMYPSAITN